MKTWLLILLILAGCNSDQPELDRISITANAFITQLGDTYVVQDILNKGEVPFHGFDSHCGGFHVDKHGNSYCSGMTNGSIGDRNFSNGSADIVVAKFDPKGNLLWLQQPGVNVPAPFNTTAEQQCYKMDVDEDGNVYCVGRTSGNLWGLGAFGGARDGFLMKLNSDGEILWITQFGKQGVVSGSPGAGDTETEVASDVTIGKDGNIYCTGYTDGPFVTGEEHGAEDDFDTFVIKFSPDGNELARTQIGGTFLGGGFGILSVEGNEVPRAITTDHAGNILIIGSTTGSLIANNSDSTQAAPMQDAYLWKLSPSLNTLMIRHYHYAGNNRLLDFRIDDSGNIFAAGATTGSLVETNTDPSALDGFVMKINPAGDVLKIAQLGSRSIPRGDTSKEESCMDVAIDRHGSIYCGGYTNGSIGEPNADSTLSTQDVFVAKWDNDLNFISAIQIGAKTSIPGGNNSLSEHMSGIHIDYFGNLYFSGSTRGELGDSNAAGSDIFIFKMDMSTLRMSRPEF